MPKADTYAYNSKTAQDIRRLVYSQFSLAELPKYKKALAKVRAGTGPCRIGIVGDSTTVGSGAGSGGTNLTDGSRPKSVPSRLVEMLSSFIPTADGGFFGDNQIPGSGVAATALYDTRLSFAGSTWSRSAGALAGQMFTASSGTDALSFTPPIACDTFDIYYAQISGGGTFTVSDSDGALTGSPINSSGSQAFIKATVTRAVASTKALLIARNGTGAAIFIAGVNCRNSASPKVEICNLGAYGFATSNWIVAGSPWSPLNSLPVLACDLWVVNLGLNDRNANVAPATYSANLQTLITALRTTGDVILIGYTPRSGAHEELEPDYQAVRKSLSDTNAIPYFDLSARWGSFAAADALGFYYDTVHGSALGYADVAAALCEILRPQ